MNHIGFESVFGQCGKAQTRQGTPSSEDQTQTLPFDDVGA